MEVLEAFHAQDDIEKRQTYYVFVDGRYCLLRRFTQQLNYREEANTIITEYKIYEIHRSSLLAGGW